MKNKILFCNLLLLLIVIIVCYFLFKKNNFESFETQEYSIRNRNDSRKMSDLKNITEYIKFPNPINTDINMVMLKMQQNSLFSLIRQPQNVEKNYSFGFYFSPNNNTNDYQDVDGFIKGYSNLLGSSLDKEASNDNELIENETFNIDLKKANDEAYDYTLIINIEGEKLEISEKDNDHLSFILIQVETDNEDFLPKATIIVNNKKFRLNLAKKETQKLSLKKITIGDGNESGNGFDGFIGSIVLFNKIIDNETLCKNFNCDINCFEPDGKTYDGNVNGCIKDCMNSCDDITKCQNICVNCEVDGQFWDKEEKKKRCPWLEDIKIMDMAIPEAPVIRGYPGDGSILVEWKQPFDGRSPISNYIVMYYESYNKKNGLQISISQQTDLELIEYEIKNLKNKTYYDIVIRAVNSLGIGKPSNIITIAPNGNIISNTNRNIFSELEDELDKKVDKMTQDYICNITQNNNVGHTLDYYDDDDINIKKYIENLKK